LIDLMEKQPADNLRSFSIDAVHLKAEGVHSERAEKILVTTLMKSAMGTNICNKHLKWLNLSNSINSLTGTQEINAPYRRTDKRWKQFELYKTHDDLNRIHSTDF